MTDQYFKHFSNFTPVPQHIIEPALNGTYEWCAGPPWGIKNFRYYNTAIKETKFYQLLEKEFGEIFSSFMKSPPMFHYNWHSDFKRSCALNWPIKDNPGSAVFYRSLYPPDQQKEIYYKIYPVTYKLYHLTLLNTDEPHCVFNNSQEERIVMTMFFSNTEVNYLQVKTFLESLKNIEW